MKIEFKALTDDQVLQVNEKVENLLWNHGITMKDNDVCDFFAKKGAKVSGQQVHIPTDMLREAIASVPDKFTLHARDPKKNAEIGIGNKAVINTHSGMNFLQEADGTRRNATVEDHIRMTKLSHTSTVVGVSNAGIVYPTVGIDPADAKYVQMINSLSYSDKPFFAQGQDETFANSAIGLAKIATGYTDKYVAMSVVNSLSPMAWDSKMLSTIRAYANQNQPLNISCCAMGGATAPVPLGGSLISTIAESLAGIVYSQLIRPGTPVVFGAFTAIMDMKTMGLALGCPEFAILCAAGAQMSSYYKMPFRGGGCLTDAQEPNMQAGIDSAMNMMVTLNSEVHFVHQALGTLDSILAGSSEKFVMDEEIVNRIERMQRGVGQIPDDILDVIIEGSNAKDFLNLENTAETFRDEFLSPAFSFREGRSVWLDENRSNVMDAAAVVKKRLDKYVEPELDAATKKAMKDYAVSLGANL